MLLIFLKIFYEILTKRRGSLILSMLKKSFSSMLGLPGKRLATNKAAWPRQNDPDVL